MKINDGICHETPDDLAILLTKNTSVLEIWNKLTPIQRNEWICWTTSVKKEETRQKHLLRLKDDLENGKKTPCCWPGCPHRKKSV